MNPGNSAIAIVFFVVPLPFLFILALVGYRGWLRHRQLQLMLDERKLLIERGVTDLPPLELPGLEEKKQPGDRYDNLKAAILLLFLAVAFVVMQLVAGDSLRFLGPVRLPATAILGALGLALLLIHFICRAAERRDRAEAGLPAASSEGTDSLPPL